MAQLIDTSVLVTLERRGWPLSSLAATAPDEPVALASITASELLMGVYRANTPERQVRRRVFVEALLGRLPVLPFDLQVARQHAQLWAELVATGQLVGAHDLLIAATAMAHGYAVLTENAREFHRVPGLIVHQPDWSA